MCLALFFYLCLIYAKPRIFRNSNTRSCFKCDFVSLDSGLSIRLVYEPTFCVFITFSYYKKVLFLVLVSIYFYSLVYSISLFIPLIPLCRDNYFEVR